MPSLREEHQEVSEWRAFALMRNLLDTIYSLIFRSSERCGGYV